MIYFSNGYFLSKGLCILWGELARLGGLAHLGEMSFTLHSYGIFHLISVKKFVMSLEKDYFDHLVLMQLLSFLAFFTINSDIKTWDTNYSQSSIHSRRTNILILFNPLVPIVACLYSLKTSESLWFSHVFRGYKKAVLGTNGLINIWKEKPD